MYRSVSSTCSSAPCRFLKLVGPAPVVRHAAAVEQGIVTRDGILHEFDVLIATTIIESGLDIPNANTIIINNANFFGLSDLHQMRGRVGRSNKKAFAYGNNRNAKALDASDQQLRVAVNLFQYHIGPCCQ